jgi:hypothetical protein
MLMILLIILVLVLLGIALSLGFFPFQIVSSPEQLKEWFRALPQTIGINLYFSWFKLKLIVAKLFGQKKSRALQFRAWVDGKLASSLELHAWVMGLPDPALLALTDGAVKYCANLNIDLAWLFGRDIDVAPAVSETVSMIISEYLEGCFKAVHHKQAIALFSVYHQLTSPDQLGRQIDLRRSVFKAVTALGLADPIPAHELIMSSELQRQALAAAALRDAASKDWDSFAQALSNVLSANEQPAI